MYMYLMQIVLKETISYLFKLYPRHFLRYKHKNQYILKKRRTITNTSHCLSSEPTGYPFASCFCESNTIIQNVILTGSRTEQSRTLLLSPCTLYIPPSYPETRAFATRSGPSTNRQRLPGNCISNKIPCTDREYEFKAKIEFKARSTWPWLHTGMDSNKTICFFYENESLSNASLTYQITNRI